MLKIAKADSVQSRQFQYTAGVDFWVRPLTRSKLRELRKQCVIVTMEPNPVTRVMEPVERLDEAKFEDALCEYLLEKWEGIGDTDGNPLPVTLENKKRILDQTDLYDFVWSKARSLDMTGSERKN
jgi:hypothetical protein